MSKQDNTNLITKVDSVLWGAISIIPFGWIILWFNIGDRYREVKAGKRSAESAINSIKNYAIGFVLTLIFEFFVMLSTHNGQIIVIPNLIAVFVILISAANNISHIRDLDIDGNNNKGNDEELLSLDDYFSRIELLKENLENIDEGDYDYELSVSTIRMAINELFKKYEDAEFPDGGKYKMYELKAEYYFVTNNKTQAKKYIEKAADVKREEESGSDSLI